MTDDVKLPTPEPLFDADTEAYWHGAGQEKLLLPQCTHCQTFVWYPRPFCPVDLSPTRWVEASGRGVVYSYTTVHRGEGLYAKLPPFVLAYVELAEGPRIMTNIVDCPNQDIRIGLKVSVRFDRAGSAGEVGIPRFAPELSHTPTSATTA